MSNSESPETAEPSQTPIAANDPQPKSIPSRSATLHQARKFLDDKDVQSSSTERKREFLRSKGLEVTEIDELLAEEAHKEESEVSLQVSCIVTHLSTI
jgi:hypothetical protein